MSGHAGPVPPLPLREGGWLSKRDADHVVINAKIRRYLHHRAERRENRSYRCDINPDLWHVTSQETP